MSFISVHSFNSGLSTGNNLFCVQLEWALRIIPLDWSVRDTDKEAGENHCQVEERSQLCVCSTSMRKKSRKPPGNVPKKTKVKIPSWNTFFSAFIISLLTLRFRSLDHPSVAVLAIFPCFLKHKCYKVHDLDTKLCRLWEQTTLSSNQVHFLLQLRKGETVILYFWPSFSS